MSSKYVKCMSLPYRQVNCSLTTAIRKTNFGDSRWICLKGVLHVPSTPDRMRDCAIPTPWSRLKALLSGLRLLLVFRRDHPIEHAARLQPAGVADDIHLRR